MSIYIQGYCHEDKDGLMWFNVDVSHDESSIFFSAKMNNFELENVQDVVSNFNQYL